MAVGATWEPGGVAAPTDWPDAGALQWETMSGIAPDHPLVGGRGGGTNYDVDADRGRVIRTLPPADNGTGGADPAMKHASSWRDLLDFKGSPAPWVLLFTLVAIGLVSGRFGVKAGPLSASAAAG